MNAVRRHNLRISGRKDGQPMLFAHGFGCDQNSPQTQSADRGPCSESLRCRRSPTCRFGWSRAKACCSSLMV